MKTSEEYLQSIDFSSLNSAKKETLTHKFSYLWNESKPLLILLFIVSYACVVYATSFVVTPKASSLAAALPVTAILAILAIYFQKTHSALRNFAKINGLSLVYRKHISECSDLQLNGLPFSYTKNTNIELAMSDKDRAITIGSIYFDTRQQNSHDVQNEVIGFNFARIAIKNTKTRIVINAKSFHIPTTLNGSAGNFTTKEPLSLEGNFDQFFSTYMETGQQIATLEILTPDVMEKLISTGKEYSFELIDGNLYLYAPYKHMSAKNIETVFRTLVPPLYMIAQDINENVR